MLKLEVDRLIGMADLIWADFQVFITIGNQHFWTPITLHSTRRLRGRLTTCYTSAARSQGKLLASIKLICFLR